MRSTCNDLVRRIREDKLEPEQAEDSPRTDDMFVGTGTSPGLFEAVRSRPFHSTMFSNCGEKFRYLKLDGKDGLDEEKFADRSEIEDALDLVLREASCGCFIGGGTGLPEGSTLQPRRAKEVERCDRKTALAWPLGMGLVRAEHHPNSVASSTYRQNAFASWTCRGVLQSASNSRGLPTNTQAHLARELATFSRLRLNRNSMPRGASCWLEVVSE